MNLLTRELHSSSNYPVKIAQFGEGNFLRAFVDYAIQLLNEKANFQGSVCAIQPIPQGTLDLLENQDGLYTLFMRGVLHGTVVEEKKVVETIQQTINPYTQFGDYLNLATSPELEFVISNTTEAGISFDPKDKFSDAPQTSFPGKLTRFLFERFSHFSGDFTKGLTIIPCELINYNADKLKEIIHQYAQLWELDQSFIDWLNQCCSFHNTLVDRIVPGYPRNELAFYEDQLNYKDQLIATAEVFFLWVIEGDESLQAKLPFHKTGLDVKIVEDMQPYRTRKVRILNGAHTSMAPLSILHGNKTVTETVEDEFTSSYIKHLIFEEIIPTLEMDQQELQAFADAVLDRFRNPFIQHQLESLLLNAVSKTKVRYLPSIIEYQAKNGSLPTHLCFAFATLIRYYKGDWKGNSLVIKDSESIMSEFKEMWQNHEDHHSLVESVLKAEHLWGRDLSLIPDLTNTLSIALDELEEKGVQEGFSSFLQKIKSGVHA